MEFVQEIKDYNSEEEEEEAEEEVVVMGRTTHKLPYSSSASSEYKGVVPRPNGYNYEDHQRLWLGTFGSDQEEAARSYDGAALVDDELGLGGHQIDLSQLRNNNVDDGSSSGRVCGGEREHMFDKVVTPSDVGKLNRLVIPKQYAEKYFPLDSSANEKGLLLNFEDRNGKPWRFRYSYWNSSQSYVMTKGWSRFVKEKKLDAGDIVSFQRGVGESGKDRLYIDWRRRPDAPAPTSLSSLHLPPANQQLPFVLQSVRWGRQYSQFPPSPSSMPHDHHHLQQLNYNYNFHPYLHHHHHHPHPHQRISYGSGTSTRDHNVVNSGTASIYYLRSSSSHQIGGVQPGGDVPMVIDSVPVVHGKTAAKRLRLFGVNMECPIPDDPERDVLSSSAVPHVTVASVLSPHLLSTSSLSHTQLRLYNGTPLPAVPAEFPKKGKTSLSFDLDL